MARDATNPSARLRAQLAGEAGYRALLSVPGVVPVLAGIFYAEIGQVHRFPTARHLCSWAGLTHGTTSRTPRCAAGRSPRWARSWCGGRRSRRGRNWAPTPAGWCLTGPGSPNAAAATSPPWRSPGKLLTLVYYGLRDGHIRAFAAPVVAA